MGIKGEDPGSRETGKAASVSLSSITRKYLSEE